MPEDVAHTTAFRAPLATGNRVRAEARKLVLRITKAGVAGAEVLVRLGLRGKKRRTSTRAAYWPPARRRARKKRKLGTMAWLLARQQAPA